MARLKARRASADPERSTSLDNMAGGWNAPRAKVQLKLSIQRLQLLQDKKTALAKQTRRDIADLLLKNKVETARVRVEVVIGDEIMVELLELLALYSELLLARFGLLENSPGGGEPDLGIKEALASVIFAAPRTEVRELQILRDMLVHRFSRDFAISAMENKGDIVNERVSRKLAHFVPSSELVDAYLEEIARTYGVAWKSDRLAGEVPSAAAGLASAESAEQPVVDETDPAATDATPVSASSTPAPPTYDSNEKSPAPTPAPVSPAVPAKKASELDLLAERFAALKKSQRETPAGTLARSPAPRIALLQTPSSSSSLWVMGGARIAGWTVGLLLSAGVVVAGAVALGGVQGGWEGWRDGWGSE